MRMKKRFAMTLLLARLAVAAALAALFAVAAVAQESGATGAGAAAATPLVVAVAECPPFVMAEGARYSGLAIYLWERVAAELGLAWEYQPYPLGELLQSFGGADPPLDADVAISCISVTVEREKLIDFSHSFTETYTAVAVRAPGLGASIAGFFRQQIVWKVLLGVLAATFLIGGVFFVLEHRINKKLYSSDNMVGKSIEAMIIGLLFATNGPLRFYRFKTLTGRILSTLLAVLSTVLIAAGTAVLASSFTINSLQSQVRSLADLRDLRVGALEASTSSDFLQANHIGHQTRVDLELLLEDLDGDRLDAIVSDAAFLSYRIREGKADGRFKSLEVLPLELDAQNYAFVLRQDSALREDVNRALLAVRKEREWRDRVRQYLGQ
ncbi:MAG: transporter substrate-binding domain-containing protein [Deinococcales bacterium]